MGHHISKPDMKVLRRNTRFTTAELNSWHKKFKKDFPDKNIDQDQFVTLYERIFGPDASSSHEFCKYVFRRYDTNHDGVIDFKEFMIALSVASRGTDDEKLLWAFKIYDIDDTGYLTHGELARILTAFYKYRGLPQPVLRAATQAMRIMRKADDNRDGRLSEAEFLHHANDCPEIKDMIQGL